jgi:hypothetical protein
MAPFLLRCETLADEPQRQRMTITSFSTRMWFRPFDSVTSQQAILSLSWPLTTTTLESVSGRF